MSFKSGFIAIIGRPNAGKSTLLNTVLHEKIAIVSDKPQTTRNRLQGIKNLPDAQIVFVDTPGIHKQSGLLNAFMVREALDSLGGVDAVVCLVEATRRIRDDELLIIESLKTVKAPVVLAVNKIDRVEKKRLLPLIDAYSKLFPFKEIVPLSALKGHGVELLIELLTGFLPEGPRYFPDDILTDRSERFVVAELIREKVFQSTQQELPYSVAVVIDEFTEDDKTGMISIIATIVVERDSHKAIVIGKHGKLLKHIGTAARKDMERMLNTKVYLELFVKVKKGWTKSAKSLKEYGYH